MSWRVGRWNLYAPYYDALIGFERARRRSMELAGIRAGQRVLVSGCGTGLDLPLLDAETFALDISPGMLAQARAKGTAARLLLGDSQRLPFADGEFDHVLLHLIVAIVPRPLEVLSEARRVVKPGGRVAVFDKYFHGSGRPRLIRRLLNPLLRFLATDLNTRTLELAEQAGLRLIAEEPAFLGGMFRVAVFERN